MKNFIQNNSEKIDGILQSFDRIILKGYVKLFFHGNNFYYFLSKENVKLKDYKSFVLKVTDQIKKHVQEIISKTGCHSEYLNTTKISKEKVVKAILSKTPDKEGLVCILSCVEPCSAITIKKNTASGKLEKSRTFTVLRLCKNILKPVIVDILNLFPLLRRMKTNTVTLIKFPDQCDRMVAVIEVLIFSINRT